MNEKKLSRPLISLIVSIALIIVGIAGSFILQTHSGKPTIRNVTIESESGHTLAMDVYIPENATAETPAPAIFVPVSYTHLDVYKRQAQHHVQLRTGCTVRTLSQSRSGYAVQFETAEGSAETLRADAVICAMGGEAGPQFGTDGFGPRFAAQCGGRVEPLYPCLTALQCAKPRKALAGIRAKACLLYTSRCV